MKNANKALSLLISAAALVSMVSCAQPAVTSKGNSLVSYTYNGDKIDFTTNDLLIKHLDKDTTASVEEYYNIAYDAKVRKYFDEDNSEAKSAKESIEREAKNEVKKKKTQAENTAKTNKTKFEDEWKAVLNSELSNLRENRRTEDALLQKYITAKMRDKIADIFYEEFKSWKKDENPSELDKQFNIFWGDNGYLETRLPYHVKHILVKVDAADGDLYNGHISAKDATDIYDVIRLLAEGGDDNTFGSIAQLKSEDSSNTSFGNLGIMDTATSFVNEFKLNTYIYDTLFNTNHERTSADKFNLTGDNKTFLEDLGVAEIPYEAVERLEKFAHVEENKDHQKVNEGNEDYFPRNIIFNKYFNNHNFGFITKTKSTVLDGADNLIKETEAGGNYTYDPSNSANTGIIEKQSTESSTKKYYNDVDEKGKWATPTVELERPKLTRFVETKVRTGEGEEDFVPKQVLCDENDNPILVARAGTSEYQGIHFIVIERSALDSTLTYKGKKTLADGSIGEYSYPSTLEEYYAAVNPLLINKTRNPNFPSFTIGDEVFNQKTYINNINSTYDDYNVRVDTLKNTIKNFDPSYDKKVYQWLTKRSKEQDNIIIKFKDGDKTIEYNITDKINKYVNREIAENKEGTFKISEDTWEGYVDFLKNQQQERSTKLIPESCALSFVSGEGYKTICKYSKDAK